MKYGQPEDSYSTLFLSILLLKRFVNGVYTIYVESLFDLHHKDCPLKFFEILLKYSSLHNVGKVRL